MQAVISTQIHDLTSSGELSQNSHLISVSVLTQMPKYVGLISTKSIPITGCGGPWGCDTLDILCVWPHNEVGKAGSGITGQSLCLTFRDRSAPESEAHVPNAVGHLDGASGRECTPAAGTVSARLRRHCHQQLAQCVCKTAQAL
jgi:hypothetical protein